MADNKLKALVDQDQGGEYDEEQDVQGQDQGGEEQSDASEEAQAERREAAGYLEVKEDAGAFSCGTCLNLIPGESDEQGTCIQQAVRAEVSPGHGCCDHWNPDPDAVTIVGHEEPEEEDEEPEEEEEESDEGGFEDEGEEDEGGGGGW